MRPVNRAGAYRNSCSHMAEVGGARFAFGLSTQLRLQLNDLSNYYSNVTVRIRHRRIRHRNYSSLFDDC